MRLFLSLLILIFSLQSLTKADDISEFEIEGMSIGDSLLDYFSEDQLDKAYPYKNKNTQQYLELFQTMKFTVVFKFTLDQMIKNI